MESKFSLATFVDRKMDRSETELYAEQAHRLVDSVIESALHKLEAEYGGVLPKKMTRDGKLIHVYMCLKTDFRI